MTGEHIHITLKERNGTACQLSLKKRSTYPLHFVVIYAQPIAQQYKSKTVPLEQSSHYEK